MSTIAMAKAIPIDGPLPEAPAFNFFSVALDLNDAAVQAQLNIVGDWEKGVAVLPRQTDVPAGYDGCSEGTFATKDEPSTAGIREFYPFEAYVGEMCSGMGIGEWEAFKARANSVLLATDAFAAERQFAQGLPLGGDVSAGVQPSLNDTNLDVLGSGIGPVEGLALLENAIGETGRAGVIHATPAIATSWSSSRLLLWTGEILRTVATRTPVIVGGGYIGTDPDAQAGPSGDSEWAFATGPVFAGRGELTELAEDIADTLDRSQNEVIYRAERVILVGWDGALQVGVLIDRSATP